ncbi:FadR family transcriptional regulator [Glaciihabitans arcticus]|uniref:FadR family transcriptional regulator n=1 Tax=Glaciihabitans arcticus TaxID=2668039 RepID=A0A4Q9GSU6_9MICO|nr:FadR/GntR family transcriptional regulator [Glaciihabitans arcticus]TBN57685.1 FadR family transcriptional regulator [Glaciihabitans arcticus]
MSLPHASDPSAVFSGAVKRAPAARLGVQVVHDLVAMIVTGSVAAGQLLPPEGELAAHFGVSRTVIRESVKRLEEKGMVTVGQGRGTEVSSSSEWNILDKVVISTMIENDQTLGILDELAVVRSELESAMSAAVATNRSPADLEEIRESLEAMRRASDNPEVFPEADKDFHSLIMSKSGNALAKAIARTLVQRASDNQRFHGAPGPDAYALTLQEHALVLDAIEAGDPDKASAAMRDHITRAWERRKLPRDA